MLEFYVLRLKIVRFPILKQIEIKCIKLGLAIN